MAHALFALAYLAIPIAAFLLVRSLTWLLATLGAATAIGGAFLAFTIERGHLWNWTQLQWLTLITLLTVLAASIAIRARRSSVTSVPMRRQAFAVLLPVMLGVAVVVISRIAAAPTSGLYTAVGFLIQRPHAEDNAKWLDFAAQLATGDPINQAVAVGGPLQLVLVPVATMLAAISSLLLGGVNQVFVASNTIVYAEFGLAALAGLALAPIAEQALGRGSERRLLSAPLVWAGIAVLGIGSFAASGLGHLTLQYMMIVAAFWLAAFLVGTSVPLVRTMASLTIAASFLVWFPFAPISLFVLVVGLLAAIWAVLRTRRLTSWLALAFWVAVWVFSGAALLGSLSYLTDVEPSAAAAFGSGGGGVRAAVMAIVHAPSLDLLLSQGGTEQVSAILGILAVITTVLATRFVAMDAGTVRWRVALTRMGPLLLVATYAVALMVIGTWWAGAGPNYGALKTTFLATMVILAVTVPLALADLDRAAVRTSMVQFAGIAAIIYLLAVDGILPRAATYVSPKQWPAISGESKGYWWPAEVKWQADQTIASLPIACGYMTDRAQTPTALPDGQKMYACTRLLAGLSGMDGEALSIVKWMRREWLTNQRAWLEEYPGLIGMSDRVRAKNIILLDVNNQVIGFEAVGTYMDRFKPDWAKEQEAAQ